MTDFSPKDSFCNSLCSEERILVFLVRPAVFVNIFCSLHAAIRDFCIVLRWWPSDLLQKRSCSERVSLAVF